MDNNSGFIKKALSLIIYKKPKDVKEFYIPEVNEKGNDPKSENTWKSAKTNTGNTQKEKRIKEQRNRYWSIIC